VFANFGVLDGRQYFKVSLAAAETLKLTGHGRTTYVNGSRLNVDIYNSSFTLVAHRDKHFYQDTLRGLPGVEVIVEGLQPELERSGLTAARIRADVERRLRDGGVVVYASQAANSSLAKAYLYV
jgi:hypothetical protein